MAGGSVDAMKNDQNYERMELLKAFDETKAGVKGVADSGLKKVPKIFVRPTEELDQDFPHEKNAHRLQIPVINLSGIQEVECRKKIVEEVGIAADKWGFFQVVNHGIPLTVSDEMIEGVRMFHEQDLEEKKKYYSRDRKQRVRFTSSYDLFTSKTASWRDTLSLSFSEPDQVDHEELPPSCRDSSVKYSEHVEDLGNILLGLLSEALGLETDSLKIMECSSGHRLHCHYYPPCPEPQLTIGLNKHSDAGFLTILLQNQIISGLQVLHQDQWVDIEPVPGGLVVNIGDLLELVSNGKFRSVEHRATSNLIGPRISVACFLSGPSTNGAKVYGPIEELLSEGHPPMYKKVALSDYVVKFHLASRLDDCRALDYYKV